MSAGPSRPSQTPPARSAPDATQKVTRVRGARPHVGGGDGGEGGAEGGAAGGAGGPPHRRVGGAALGGLAAPPAPGPPPAHPRGEGEESALGRPAGRGGRGEKGRREPHRCDQ